MHGPAGLRARFRIDEVEETAHRWVWTVRPVPPVPPVPGLSGLSRLVPRLRLEHGVIARGDGCVATLRLDGPPGLIHAYVPMATWALWRLTR